MANNLFVDYDVDNNGSLDRKEVKKIIDTLFNEISKSHQIDEGKANKMFSTYDVDGDNKLSKEEFVKVV